MPLCDTAVVKQAFPWHYLHGHFRSVIAKKSRYDSVSCRCPTPSQHNPLTTRTAARSRQRLPGSSKSYWGLSWTAQVTECVTTKNQQKEKRLRLQKQLRHLKAVWDSQGNRKEKKGHAVLSRGAERGLCCSFSPCCSTDTLQTWAHLHLRSTFRCLKLLILLNSQAPHEPRPEGSCKQYLPT